MFRSKGALGPGHAAQPEVSRLRSAPPAVRRPALSRTPSVQVAGKDANMDRVADRKQPANRMSSGAAAETQARAVEAVGEGPEAATQAAAAEAEEQVNAADWTYTMVQQLPLAGGMLHLVQLHGERMLRVWLPPGYSREAAKRRPYRLLLLNDGQNLFEDALSFSGHSWRAAHTAAALISSGRLPPFLVVGIDHAGTARSHEYLPYKPGAGPGGFRRDAAEWPGGGVAAYMGRVVGGVLPFLAATYGTSQDACRTAFGGSSFGAICALWACMHHPGVFGAVLVESPSLWFADERFLREDLPQYQGPWPQRMFLAIGDREFTGTRGLATEREAAGEGAKWDDLLVWYCQELAAGLEAQGLDGSRLMWQIGTGAAAAHNEEAWAARLPNALAWLLQPWRADTAEP